MRQPANVSDVFAMLNKAIWRCWQVMISSLEVCSEACCLALNSADPFYLGSFTSANRINDLLRTWFLR